MPSNDSGFHRLLLVATQQFITWAAYLVSALIDAFQWSLERFPNATRIMEGLLIAYMAWRCSVRIIRAWWRLCKFLLKMALFYLAIVIMLGVYVRGFETFFLQDMYKCWTLIKYIYKNAAASHSKITYIDPMGTEESAMMKAASSFLRENKNVVDSMESQFYEARNHAEDFIRNADSHDYHSKLKNVHDFAAYLGLV